MVSGVAVANEASTAGVPAAPSRLRRIGRWCTRHPALTAFLVALGIRALLAVGIYLLHDGAIFGDETTYTGLAEMAAAGETGSWDPFIRGLYWGTATFTVPMTALFWLFGPKILVAQLLAGFYAAVAAGLTARVAAFVAAPGLALAAGLVVALMPSQVLFSTLVLKDSGVWATLAALAVVIAAMSRSRGRSLLWGAAAAAVVLWLLGHLREHTTVVAVWAMLSAAVIPADERVRRVGALAVVAALVPALVGIGPFGVTLILDHGSLVDRRAENAEGAETAFVPSRANERLREVEERRVEAEIGLGESERELGDIEEELRRARDAQAAALAAELEARLQAARAAAEQRRAELRALREQEARARARAAATPTADLGESFGEGRGTSSQLRHLPLGLRVMVLDPLPWHATSNLRVQLAKAENLLWYPLLAAAAYAVIVRRRDLDVFAFPLLASGGIFVMYALSEGNFGTAFRHRGETVWAMAIMAVAGVEAILRRRSSATDAG